MTDDLEISLDRNCSAAERFRPSLFCGSAREEDESVDMLQERQGSSRLTPRWLYDEMARGLMPAPTRNSARTLLTLVCPLLRSSPATNAPVSSASLMTPGTNVF